MSIRHSQILPDILTKFDFCIELNIDTSTLRISLSDFLLKYKVDNNAISLRPRGLTNRSNYCYINAILQALVACPPFFNLMKAIPLDAPAHRLKTNTPTIDAVVELVREFSNLPNGSRLQRRDKGGNKKEDVTYELACDTSFEPTAIHKLWNSTRSDSEGRQEDAEEFLGYVLNKLNDEMLEVGVNSQGRHFSVEAIFYNANCFLCLVEKISGKTGSADGQ